MKPTVRIVQSGRPKRGRFIPEGSYDYFHTPEGSPAINFRWQGFLLPGSKATFVFPRDVDQISAGGAVISLIPAGIGTAAARTSHKGFSVVYQNPNGHLAVFVAVAPPEIVDEIFSAVPKEKHTFAAVFLAYAGPEVVAEILSPALSPAMRRDLRDCMTKIKER